MLTISLAKSQQYIEEELCRRSERDLKEKQAHALAFDVDKKFGKGERQAVVIGMLNLNRRCSTDDIILAIRDLFAIKYIRRARPFDKK
jgi:hypothetical protein